MLQGDVACQEQQQVQAVRAVNKDLPPTSVTPARPEEVYYVDTHPDPETQKPVVLWDDIHQAFDNAVQIRDRARVVPFLKGADLRNLEPRRIAAVPNTVLDVVVSSPSVETKVTWSLPGSIQENEDEKKPVKDVVASQSTPATSRSTVRGNPGYGLENTAMDNYSHIDRPPPPQRVTTNSSARCNPVWGLENTAMDYYSHIDNPAFAPPLRGPQALLDNLTLTVRDLPALAHSSNGRGLSSRAPQSESATTNALKERDLVQLSIGASQGNTSAQVALGDVYSDGEGVPQDHQSAMDWYLMAANQGDPTGQRRVGFLYHGGLGVLQSYSTALEWFIKAADQGDPGAQYNIGMLYDRGQGVEQDFTQAMQWYLKATKQGHASAQYSIGSMYYLGKGAPQDLAKAMEWYRMAADQGFAEAQYFVGIVYASGQGVTKNDSEARKWIQKAADKRRPAFAPLTSTTPPHPTEVVYVDIYTDRITKDKFILWEDIRLAFHHALHVRHKARVVPFVKDGDFNTYAYGPVGNTQDNAPQQQPSVLRQIEQQAAPPGNNFARIQNTRQHLGDAAVRARNKELARKHAKEAMTKIADAMDLDALHTKGDAAPAFFWKALGCCLRAVHQSHAHAQVHVGDLFYEGQDVSKNSFVAMRCSERQKTAEPETPTPKAQRNSNKASAAQPLSDNHEPQISKEIPTLVNEASVLSDISLPTKPVVNQNDIDAQVALGDNYMDNQDYQVAMECYFKAANQGHPGGQRRVGAMYHNGDGVTQHYSTAMRWYLKSANQGDSEAQPNIGTLYKHGHGVPQDLFRAMNWHHDAANQGLAEGQYRGGCMYHSGESTVKDDSQAVHWFLKAADQGP
ncbi:MAG: hypothetical protein JOS17DRAFT_820855 [Linnemannia elongata]|nr:MAG: hypothetical protein JOS17DRAFT_820855 [Linnemannia elongata]